MGMESVDPLISTLYRVFDLIGVVLNGIIGGTIARRREFDFVGFLFLALFSSMGGGLIRDMLIGSETAAAMSDPAYLTLALIGAMIAFLTDLKGNFWEIFKAHGDAIILGVWSVTGAVKALSNGLPLIACVFMGLLTAVGGGMLRDVVAGMTPSIFGGSPLYALPAIIGAILMVVFSQSDLMATGMIISPLVATTIAIIAFWRSWVIPRRNFAPVNYTAAQVASAVRRAEQRGVRKGRKEDSAKDGKGKRKRSQESE